MPVSSEISAFHSSTPSGLRMRAVQPSRSVGHRAPAPAAPARSPRGATARRAGDACRARAAGDRPGAIRPASTVGLHARVVESSPGDRTGAALHARRPRSPAASGRCARHRGAGPSGNRLAASSARTAPRVQRDRAVGQVNGLPAGRTLGVERTTRRDDGAEVGDRVVDAEPVAGARLHAQRLVEVLRSRAGRS